MLEATLHWVNSTTAVLYGVVYSNDWFFVDYWSFVHFFTGSVLLHALRPRGVRQAFAVLLAVLLAWEVLELSFIYVAIGVFRPETVPDQVTDIVVGLLGGVLACLAATGDRTSRAAALPDAALATDRSLAAAIALVWVSGYGYHYNIGWMNSPAVNWLAWLLWATGLLAALRLYRRLDRAVGAAGALPLLWVAHVFSLAGIEFLGYVVLGVRETGGGPALAFGLCHGTKELHLFYTTAPLLAVAAQRMADILMSCSSVRERRFAA